MTGSTAESDLRGDTRRARVLLKSDSGSEWKFCSKSKPVIHYSIFISTKTRKQSQVSLFSKRIPIFVFVHNFVYIIHFVPSPAMVPKMLVGGYQRHQRWRPQTLIWGGSISWTTNKSASARNTAVAFYPRVYRGVIYISTGKVVSEKIYRLVDELYLDWIFSCINRGKILTW
jgi:hypothetical protein